MDFEEQLVDYRMVAPDVDALLRCFDRGFVNPGASTPELLAAAELLFSAMEPLAPVDQDGETKAIWLRIPRGTIDDYASFEDMKAWEEVETYEEYLACWQREYPEELMWYELVVTRSLNPDGTLRYYGVSLGNKIIMSALTEGESLGIQHDCYKDPAACRLCSIVLPAIEESIDLLRSGEYNRLVEDSLPYQFRVGVIRRSDLWEVEPDAKAFDYDGLSEGQVCEFKALIESGANSAEKIGRIRHFTANDFFRACKLGYEAIGKDCTGFTLSELYRRYADGRDEGLTGKGYGLNAGPGIDFDDAEAWDEWYFHRPQQSGHPWEVVPGGNSTHMSLFVRHDRNELEWKLRLGEIEEEEYRRRLENAGYYFGIAGTHRQFETVSFYLALFAAGLPVVVRDAEKLLVRFKGTDWMGIVPHHVFPRYCESFFPGEYGPIVDFMHVFKDEDAWFDRIVWLPEDTVQLQGSS